jgi:hypothetical protein
MKCRVLEAEVWFGSIDMGRSPSHNVGEYKV